MTTNYNTQSKQPQAGDTVTILRSPVYQNYLDEPYIGRTGRVVCIDSNSLGYVWLVKIQGFPKCEPFNHKELYKITL